MALNDSITKPAAGTAGINSQAEAEAGSPTNASVIQPTIMAENNKRDKPHRGDTAPKGQGVV